METWGTVIVAFIVAASTLGATWFQNRYSSKRFEKELEQQREKDTREWRRKVRSEPLLELRNVLAVMANKQESIIYTLQGAAISKTDIFENKMKQLYEDWSAYISDFQRCLYIQYDTEIIRVVQKIMGNYHESWLATLADNTASIETFEKAMKTCDKNKKEILRVQELINKKIEEL
jgi:hypothetical protein